MNHEGHKDFGQLREILSKFRYRPLCLALARLEELERLTYADFICFLDGENHDVD